MLPSDRNDNEHTGIRMVHPGSRQLFRYWEGLRAERACPTRDEIDLSKIANLLPSITVLEQAEQRFWRHRMAGSEVCELLNEQVTWRDALLGFDRLARNTILNLFEIAVAQAQPAILRLRLIGQHHVIPTEMLVLPILDAAKNKHQLFCSVLGFNTDLVVSGAPLIRRELISARLIFTEHSTVDMVPSFRSAPQLQLIKGGIAN